MTFREWLVQKEDEHSWIGDLAGDVFHDADSQSIENTYRAWKDYLISCNAVDNALKALKQAWKEYEHSHKS
jgi:hypothetical protein